MTRVKKATNAIKYRRNLLKSTKGYRFGLSTKERMANDAMLHAGAYAFAHRRDKKNDRRKMWNTKINALLRQNGQTYSKFIHALKIAKIALDRKILADFAENNPETFKKVLEMAGQKKTA